MYAIPCVREVVVSDDVVARIIEVYAIKVVREGVSCDDVAD